MGRPTERPTDATGVPRTEGILLERLGSLLEPIWSRRLALIVSAPGSGKTTLMAAFAAGAGVDVAWYRADRWDSSEEALVARLGHAFGPATEGRSLTWRTLQELVAGLERWDPERALFVIDDLHELEGRPSEDAIARLLDRMPPGLHVLAATRAQPGLNLSRLRVADQLVEIGPDDLRFRTWEVERLFGEHYREPMPPEELARLARWTEGWVAGLQLFHLATRGRPADERRRVLRSLGPRSRLAHEYLAQNVLDRVRDDIRSFLLATSILGRLDGATCDRLLGRRDSAAILDELERRCLFTVRLDDEGGYRYHEVFRSFLQGVLVAQVGEEDARRRFRAAGELLATDGRTAEALDAYARAEAWDLVERLLASHGEVIADGPLEWVDRRPWAGMLEDSWLALATARRLRAEGRFVEALAAYASVAQDSRTRAAADAARRERATLTALLEPGPLPPTGRAWWVLLRRALRSDPDRVADSARGSGSSDVRLVGCLARLLAGDTIAARFELADLAEDDDTEGLVACVAMMAHGAASLLAGETDGIVRSHGAVGAAEGLGWEWLARVGRSLLALTGREDHLREAVRIAEAAEAAGDRWGAALARTACAWGRVAEATGTTGSADVGDGAHASPLDEAVEAASDAAGRLRALGAPVLEAWARAIAAQAAALAGRPDAQELASGARRLARAAHVEHAEQLSELARASARGDRARVVALARRLQDAAGLAVAPIDGPPVASTASRPVARRAHADDGATRPAGEPPARLRLLGTFDLELDGRPVDLPAIRPRVRSLLQLLAMDVNTPLHREAIIEALWPDSDPDAAARNLHVAMASLRRVLEPDASRGSFRLVRRDGDRYLLSLPPGSPIDVLEFEAAVGEATASAARGDARGQERWSRLALDRYAGDLLPEQGPAEWVVSRRDALRAMAVETSTRLARLLVRQGDHEGAAATCASGLRHDRYHDPLWRTLIEAREAAGDRAAARTARRGYRRALEELGIAPLAAAVSPP